MKFDTEFLIDLSSSVVKQYMKSSKWFDSPDALAQALDTFNTDKEVVSAAAAITKFNIKGEAVQVLGKLIREQFRIYSKADFKSFRITDSIINTFLIRKIEATCAGQLVLNGMHYDDRSEPHIQELISTSTTVETFTVDLTSTAPLKFHWLEEMDYTAIITWSRYYKDGQRIGEVFHLRGVEKTTHTHIFYRYAGIYTDYIFSSEDTDDLLQLACYMVVFPDIVQSAIKHSDSTLKVIYSVLGKDAIHPMRVMAYEWSERKESVKPIRLTPLLDYQDLLKSIIGPIAEVQRKAKRQVTIHFETVRW